MSIDLFKRLLLIIVLCLAQALVLNHIHLFGCATPLLYIFVILVMPKSMPKWGALLWGFFIGMIADIFSNTPGVASASLTAVAAVQPFFFKLFIQQDAPEDVAPSSRFMGWGPYTFYVFVLTLLFCTLFYTLETFSFFNWSYWLERIAGSTILTTILVVTLENLRKK